jgi:hypothetical protein
MKRVGLLVGCALCLASCGGGGNNPIAHPVSTYRANGVGDSWTYKVAINFGQFGSDTGSLSSVLTADTYNGQPSIRDTEDFTIDYANGPHDTVSYSETSTSGLLLATMVDAVLYNVTSDTFSTGNTLSPTTAATGVITLSNGETLTESFKVVGTAFCTTPAGQFACWVATQSTIDSNGTTDHFTMWIAPETGNYVQIKDTTLNPDGTGYTYTASLTAMASAANRPTSTASSPSFGIPRRISFPSPFFRRK